MRRISYRLNKETLTYELLQSSGRKVFAKGIALFLLSVAAFVGYYWLYTDVAGLKTPKQVLVEKRAAEWQSKLDELSRSIEDNYRILAELQRRDNRVYRPVFGMEEIPDEVREAGIGGTDRYDYLQMMDPTGIVTPYVRSLDILAKMAYVQSRSYDDVAVQAETADEMALCVPTISPVMPDPGRIFLSSSFGYRRDPVYGKTRYHEGIDLAGRIGVPVYVTGNARVTDVGFDYFGYGHFVTVDHGFGYQTRYAHMSQIFVSEGQELRRGDQIGLMGNSGKSTGPHLHYEVIYRGRAVNPYKYVDLEIPQEEYMRIVRPAGNTPDQV